LAFRFRRFTGTFVCFKRRASLQNMCHFWTRRRWDFPSPPTVAIEKSAAKRAAFERALLGCEEVMECYLMTGAFDYIGVWWPATWREFERFVMTRLAAIEGVRDVSTSITLRRVQYKTVLPVREGGE
jgi:DNA-binding Lrp family transcriptional regulator